MSHDRRFLDNVVTSTIAWAGDERPGLWREHEGGWEDWARQRERRAALAAAHAASTAAPPAAKAVPSHAPVPAPATAAAAAAPRRKLSYKDQRELDALPARIEALEAEQRELQAMLADPAFYVRDAQAAAQAGRRAQAIEDELMAALERWSTLEGGPG